MFGGYGADKDVVDTLAEKVASIGLAHPTRVGIDGPSAAGKTTMANELGEALRRTGREVLRASIDDFHRPGHKQRSERDEWTPRSYYDEGYDYTAFRDLLCRTTSTHRTTSTRGCVDRTIAKLHHSASLRSSRMNGNWKLAAFAIILDAEQRVLLCHRRDMDLWNLPGGGVESRETP